MKFKDLSIRTLKYCYRFLTRKKFPLQSCETDRQRANDIIFNTLISDKPCMIARFGTTELITINNYLCISEDKAKIKKIWNYISQNTHAPWWQEENFHYLDIYSGVFPATQEISEKFSKRYLEDIPLIDVLGSFQYYEKFMPLALNHKKIHLETLYPFFVKNPWTRILKGKKVLVVHPFEASIKKQYSKREKLFEDNNILPEFSLITIKAVQSAAGIRPNFKDWFDALKFMENEIDKIDFDICLLGCGAYGLPLAAHIKKKGKKAIHLGGGLQLLFGIKGKRWDNKNYGINEFKDIPNLMKESYFSLYNEHWIRPLEEDTPTNKDKLDGAVYW